MALSQGMTLFVSGQPETGKTLTILQGTLLPSFGIFPWKKMDLVLKGLRTQLDADYEVLRRLPFLVARDFSLDLHGAHSTGVLVRPHQTAEKSASILVNFSKCDCEKRAMATPPLSFLLSNFEAPELGCKLMN